MPERRDAHFLRWLEYYANGRWYSYYPAEPTVDALRYYLPWWRGRNALIHLSGGKALDTRISTSRSYELAIHTALTRQRELERKLVEFSLFGLPQQAQSLFRTLVVIPAGVFLLVVLRNLVGVKTFGTFMPVLIALSFRQTGLAWGIVFFATVVALGLEAAGQLNALHDAAHRTGWTAPADDPRLRQAYAEVQRILSEAPSATPGRFRYSGTCPSEKSMSERSKNGWAMT